MTRQITISDESWAGLQRWAEPIVDTADDAVRKLLAAADAHRECIGVDKSVHKNIAVSPNAPLSTGDRTTRSMGAGALPRDGTHARAFYEAIGTMLLERGGSAHITKAWWSALEKNLRSTLRSEDYDSDGRSVRWIHLAQSYRMGMVRSGLLRRGSPRGVWELSEKGRQVFNA